MVLMRDVNKGLRFLILIGIIGVGYLMYELIVSNAPIESLNWLEANPIWNYGIFIGFSFSLSISGLGILFPELVEETTKQTQIAKQSVLKESLMCVKEENQK